MSAISTVIITRNEARNILSCIDSARAVSDDVIVVDCGSDDDTAILAMQAGATLIETVWKCYGHSRNLGAAAAKNDWILALDADERVSSELAVTLNSLSLEESDFIYRIRRHNYFGKKKISFGTLGFEKLARLYNRRQAHWDLVPVHEKLTPAANINFIREPIWHYGITSVKSHREKKEWYAYLSAQKYWQQKKKASLVKRFITPVFNGLKSYVFLLGFLDGSVGWQIARAITYYTWLKYHYLHQIGKQSLKLDDNTIYSSNFNGGRLTSFLRKEMIK